MLIFCVIIFTGLFVGSLAITSAATIEQIHDSDGVYPNASYSYSDTFCWEGLSDIITTRTFSKGGRKVTTKLNVAPVSLVKLDVLCRIGKNSSDYDFDRKVISSSYTYTATASELWTIFKKMGYTAHFAKTSDPNPDLGTTSDYITNEWEDYSGTNDMGFKGRWIYD